MRIGVGIAIAAIAAPALAQSDPRAAAHAEIASILNANVEGSEMPLGWVPDLFRYSVSSSACRTDIVRVQRTVRGQRNSYQGHTENQRIIWGDVVSVGRTTIVNSRRNPNGALVISRNGTRLVYGLRSEREMWRLLEAMEMLRIVCAPGASRPAPQPQLQPEPQPGPEPRAIPEPPRVSPPQPKTGFFWLDPQRRSCGSYAVRPLQVYPPNHATYMLTARGSEPRERLVLTQRFGTTLPPDWPMENSIFVQSPTGPGHARKASIAFDGRPSGLQLQMSDGRYPPENERRIYLPADFVDRLANVSVMTLTLHAANGSAMRSWDFDVADARLIRSELASINWNCTGAR